MFKPQRNWLFGKAFLWAARLFTYDGWFDKPLRSGVKTPCNQVPRERMRCRVCLKERTKDEVLMECWNCNPHENREVNLSSDIYMVWGLAYVSVMSMIRIWDFSAKNGRNLQNVKITSSGLSFLTGFETITIPRWWLYTNRFVFGGTGKFRPNGTSVLLELVGDFWTVDQLVRIRLWNEVCHGVCSMGLKDWVSGLMPRSLWSEPRSSHDWELMRSSVESGLPQTLNQIMRWWRKCEPLFCRNNALFTMTNE